MQIIHMCFESIKFKRVVMVGLALMVSFFAVASSKKPGSLEVVRGFFSELVLIANEAKLTGGTLNDKGNAAIERVLKTVDVLALSRQSLGPKRWAGMTEVQKSRFQNVLRELLRVVVFPKSKKLTTKLEDIQFSPVQGKSNEVRAATTLEREKRGEKVREEIEIVVVTRGEKVVDALLEGELLSKNFRRQFDEAFKTKSVDAVLKQLDERVASAKKTNAAKRSDQK